MEKSFLTMDYFLKLLHQTTFIMRKKEGFEGERAIIIPPKIIKQYRDKPITKEFYITDIGYYPKAKHHYRDRPEGTEEHIIIHCIEGKGVAIINNHSFEIHPNDFLIIPSSIKHTYHADTISPWTIYWAHFSGLQSDIISACLYKKMLAQQNSIMYNEKHLELFNTIYSTLQQGYSRENMEFIALTLPYYFSAFLLHDRFNFSQGTQTEDPTDQAIIFLKNRVNEPITLKDIAEHVHLSISHFSNIFHKKTGYSPIEYFNHLKIQRACQLLQFTDKRIFEVALAIGLEDPYYFSRLFTTHMGISPKNYRMRWSLKPKL
ncbi:AraC-like ligand binding domain-containing protein [Olivibacter domesticus]|uniref:AraC-like ligand binding domain-containing protein n=2 Tax=Olivibacter domesticus TaxID=407022 RepID=A0A1H7M1Y0_OLID1|nr:AraC-like ligand binding domain-containing protein [Olivibacter domesticus]